MSRFPTTRHAPGCACYGCISARARSIQRGRRVQGFRGTAAPPRPQRENPPPARFTWRPRLKWHSDRGIFVLTIAYEDREFAKRNGFRWDPGNKERAIKACWYTFDERYALRLLDYADEDTRRHLRPHVVDEDAVEASRATDAEIEVPCPPGLAYMPFQRAGIAYALMKFSQNAAGGVLFAHEMGLGKTVMAIGAMNFDPNPFPALVICPASLKVNWRRELERWLTHPTLPMIAGDWFPITADVVVVNPERLGKHAKAIASKRWRTLIVDEAHWYKSMKAQRSQAVYAIDAERRLFLTGTPIVNRPMEFYPLLTQLAPQAFGDARKFKARYADAKPWMPRGRAVLEELQERARSACMVRVLKKDVLTELPPKVRQVIEFSSDGIDALRQEYAMLATQEERSFALRVAVELAKAGEDEDAYEAAVAKLQDAVRVGLSEMSRVRHMTALAKVPMVREHVKAALDQGDRVILFGHHHDVLQAYQDAFPRVSVKLTGEMDMRDRQASVDRFMKDEACLLFVGSIQAAGVGLTLTSSSHVCFAELDWVPGNMTQAEDRAHRIGQRESVLVQHLVLEGSLDARMARALVAKQEVIDRALDARDEAEAAELKAAPIVPSLSEQEHATSHVSRTQIGKDAARVTPGMQVAVKQALDMLPAHVPRIDRAVADELVRGPMTARRAALGRRIANRYRDELSEELRKELARWP